MKDLHLSHRQSVACNCRPWPDVLPALTLFASLSGSMATGSIMDQMLGVRTVCFDRQGRIYGKALPSQHSVSLRKKRTPPRAVPGDDLAKLASVRTGSFIFHCV
jgi:hypothetical protein